MHTTFQNLAAGDRVTFKAYAGRGLRGPEYTTRRARVLRYLTFPDHVIVNHGSCGTLVDAENFISARKARRG